MTELQMICHWIVIAVDQGKDGLDVVWHGWPRQWDPQVTRRSLHFAQQRSRARA